MNFRKASPDFRNMTPDQIRDGLHSLNQHIKYIKSLPFENIEFHLRDLEEERRQYKEVWRARPGRKYFNTAARKEREKQRKKNKPKTGFPFIP